MQGVRQGCVLSAFVFILLLAMVIKDTEESLEKKYVPFKINGECITHLGWADDIVLIQETSESLQLYVDTLIDNARNVGLEINLKKTKAMNTTKNVQTHITIEGKIVEQVTCYEYLGFNVSSESDENAIDNRQGKAWAVFHKNKVLLKS